ncbi:MAG: TldD/PmbA family protein [Candidatus Njordarchaeales archaeon]
MDVGDISQYAIKQSESYWPDQIEAFTIKVKMKKFYYEGEGLSGFINNEWWGLGIKSVIDKRIGYSSGMINKISDIKKIVEKSIKMARVSPKDKDFESLPPPTQISGSIADIFDKNMIYLDEEEIIKEASFLLNKAKEADIKITCGQVKLIQFEFNVMNSLGVNFSHKATNVFIFFQAMKERGEGIVKAYSTTFRNINWDVLWQELYRRAKNASEAERIKGSHTVEVIIDPIDLSGLFSSYLRAANGEFIYQKRSPWINKLNEKVASESLTIIDDGRMPGGLMSALADDEGVPTKKKIIINRGILESYYFDYYTARALDGEPTGNGFRRDTDIEDAHTKIARSNLSNVEILHGNKDKSELIEEIDFGLYIDKFSKPIIRNISGDFSLEIRNSFLIKNGEIINPISHVLLVGNIYDIMNKITGIGKEPEMQCNFKLPAMRFENLKLIGL